MKNPKIKILHITFNMAIGGTEQVIRQIVENSNPERFFHEILCIDGVVGTLGQSLQKKGIYIVSLKREKGFDFSLVRDIHKTIKQREIDVLHCHQYTPYFYGVLAALGTRVKIIFTEHGRFYPDLQYFKRRFINPLLLLRTQHITAISKSTAEALAKYEYLPRKKIKIIYNGIRDLNDETYSRTDLLNELDLLPGFRYIGTISRLEPIKNQTMMIKGFSKVKEKIPKLKLILIGDGSKKAELEELVKTLNIEKDVIFTGFLDNPQKFIQLFEIFLLSSFSEGTSMTLLEAMSLSKPCIVTNVGGNPEIIYNNENGLVIQSNDSEAFSEAIINLLMNINSNVMGAEGRRKFLNKFTVSHMISEYERIYR